MKKLMIALAVLAMAAGSSFAAVNDNAGTIFPILNIGVGARGMAMGEAFTAIADDASAIYWNAAGLSNVKSVQVGLVYDKMLMDTMFGQVVFAYPLAVGTLGADVTYLSMGKVTGRDEYGTTTEEIYPYNLGASIGYGLDVLGLVSVGGSLKMVSQSMGATSDMAFALDLGALYKAGIISAGVSVQNIALEGGYTLPTNVAAGVAVKALDTKENAVLAAVDLQYLINDAASVCAGVEYTYNNLVSARIGYKLGLGETDLEGLNGLSAGVGVKYENINFDYAMVTSGDLGITHKATLLYSFGSAAK